jgi:Putative Actinobacterial Holin-X, holin superfamily III
MQMEDIKDKTADLADHVEDLADTFYKLTVLKAAQKATNITSGAIAIIIVCTFGFFVLLFGGLALSWWLGNLLENRTAGFLLGAAFFLILMIILVLLRRKIVFPFIRDLIIRKLYE